MFRRMFSTNTLIRVNNNFEKFCNLPTNVSLLTFDTENGYSINNGMIITEMSTMVDIRFSNSKWISCSPYQRFLNVEGIPMSAKKLFKRKELLLSNTTTPLFITQIGNEYIDKSNYFYIDNDCDFKTYMVKLNGDDSDNFVYAHDWNLSSLTIPTNDKDYINWA